MKLNAVLLFFFLFSLALAAKVRRIGSGLDENQIFEENGVDTKMNTLEKLWRGMKYRFGQEEENKNNQYDSQLDLQVDDQQENQAENRLNKDKERVESETEDESSSININDEDNANGPMNKTIKQNDQEEKPESPQLEDRPNQMAPITKALLYIRPKRDERWVMLEEGSIRWAISSYLQPYASEVLMNCNLYRDGNMILSVFRGVPLSVGTESWTPPGFLEPAPNYQLRIWNQPSRIGLIDEYSALFSIVPSAEDAFMFNSDPKQVVNETLKNDGQLKKNESSGDDQKPAEEVNKYKVITHNFVPGMPNAGSNINFINQKQGPSGSSTAIPPNIPTGIYALYPSISTKMSPTSFCALWTSAFLAIYIATL